RVMGIDLGTAPTPDPCFLGVGANHRYRGEVLALQWQHILLVLEKNHALPARFTDQRAMFGQIESLLWCLFWMLKSPDFDQQLEQTTHTSLNGRFLNLAMFDGLKQFLIAPDWGTRHLQIEPGI